MEPRKITADPYDILKKIPRERWATVMGLIMVRNMPREALQAIALEGRRLFIKRGLKADVVGLKHEDYSDIYAFIVLTVQRYNQALVDINATKH